MSWLRPALCALLVSGCASAPWQEAACPLPGETRQLRVELYFGLDRPRGPALSEAEWRDFVAREVTPRFPDGLSELDMGGQWRDRVSGRIGREPSRLLLLITPPAPDLAARIEAIRSTYRRRFDQQSVGVSSAPVCAGF